MRLCRIRVRNLRCLHQEIVVDFGQFENLPAPPVEWEDLQDAEIAKEDKKLSRRFGREVEHVGPTLFDMGETDE